MRLIDKLPQFHQNSIDTEIQGSLNVETDLLHEEVANTLEQFFVDDCTWGLSYWENMLGISGANFDLQTRRENIKSKMRSRGTSTVALIKSVCESYSNGTVDVIEYPSEYKFVVKFVGTLGVPKAMDQLKLAVEKIKPCHLACEYEYSFITWNDFDKYNYPWDKWDTLNLTWNDLEIYKK